MTFPLMSHVTQSTMSQAKIRHGTLINAAVRAVTSHNWDASSTDWTRASYGYGAIHFHDDDLDDAA